MSARSSVSTTSANNNGTTASVTAQVRIGALLLLLLYVAMAVAALFLRLSVRGVDPLILLPVLFSAYPAMGALILVGGSLGRDPPGSPR